MRFRLIALSTLFGIMCGTLVVEATAAGGETGPSKQETFDFIKSYVSKRTLSRNGSRKFDFEVSNRNGNTCELLLTKTWSLNDRRRTQVFFVPMSKMAPKETEIVEFDQQLSVALHVMGDEKLITYTMQNEGDPIETDNSPWTGLMFAVRDNDRRNAERLKKAFAHLATICGGKNNLF